MNKYKKLLSNSIIFAIGNFGSKIISIILVPLYTFYLSTSEYGTVDIITTTITLLLPLISLTIYEAVLRFIMDKNESKQAVITNALVITLIGVLIATLFYPLLMYFNLLGELLNYMYLILILQAFQSLMSQYTRAVGKVKIFAVSGIIQSLVLGMSNIILLVFLKQGITGYLSSIILANIITILFFVCTTDILSNINYKKLNKNLTVRMLIYSIPLIPNTIMWWLVNTSNRYFILYFEGPEINGLFAVAYKIPTLLILFTVIFSQAWQLSAIEEYDSESKSKFYSQTFYYYQAILLIGTSAILVVLKFLMDIAFAEEYYIAWKYVPFLLLGVVFSSFSGFIGTNYIAAKQTKGLFKTTMIGSLLSVLMNLILVPTIGAVGAGVSTIVGFSVMWILRINDTKRYISMEIETKKLVISLILISIQIFTLFLDFSKVLEFTLLSFIFVMNLLIYRGTIKQLIRYVKKRGFKPKY